MSQGLLSVVGRTDDLPSRFARVPRAGSSVVVIVDETGASVAAEMLADDFERMSPSLRGMIGGRPHIQTWCNRYGRIDVPVTLLSPLLAAA